MSTGERSPDPGPNRRTVDGPRLVEGRTMNNIVWIVLVIVVIVALVYFLRGRA